MLVMRELEQHLDEDVPNLADVTRIYLRMVMKDELINYHVFGDPKRARAARLTLLNKRKGRGAADDDVDEESEVAVEEGDSFVMTVQKLVNAAKATVTVMDVTETDIHISEKDAEKAQLLIRDLSEAQAEWQEEHDRALNPTYRSYPNLIIRPLKGMLTNFVDNNDAH
jgi:hypothetical protein